MAFKATKTDWTPEDGISYDDLNRIEGNIKALGIYPTAGGNGTAITLDLGDMSALQPGTVVNFIANASNGGGASTINGKPLYKPGTTSSPNLAKDKAYTAIYNKASDCFFIKASASGTALAKHVQKPYTFSNDDDTDIPGTLDLSLLTSGNVRSGVNINGVIGDSNVVNTSDATANAGLIYSGYSAYVKGLKVIGTMPTYLGGVHVTAQDKTAGVYSPNDGTNYAYMRPTAGYYDGQSWARIAQPDLLPQNIVADKNIMGVTGNAQVSKKFTGSGTTSGSAVISIPNIPFTPSYGFIYVYGEAYISGYQFFGTIIYEPNGDLFSNSSNNVGVVWDVQNADTAAYDANAEKDWTASFANGTFTLQMCPTESSARAKAANRPFTFVFVN